MSMIPPASSAAAAPAMPSPVRLIATLGVIAMLSGFIIVLVYQVTLEPIAQNHREALEQAVFNVLPGATTRANFRLEGDTITPLPDEAVAKANCFAGYDEEGNLVGVALEGAGRGYAGEIRVLYGYSPEKETLIGFSVLQSSETPGLGDKIETDPQFLANFEGLDVSLNDAGTELVHAPVTVKSGTKSNPWEIDGITGATVSSEAVGRAIRHSAMEKVPTIYAHQEMLASEPHTEGEE